MSLGLSPGKGYECDKHSDGEDGENASFITPLCIPGRYRAAFVASMITFGISVSEIVAIVDVGVRLSTCLRACVHPIHDQSAIDKELQALQKILLQTRKYLQETELEHEGDAAIDVRHNLASLEDILPKLKHLHDVSLINVKDKSQSEIEERELPGDDEDESASSETDSDCDYSAYDGLSKPVPCRIKSDLQLVTPRWILAEQKFPDNPHSRVLVYDPSRRTVEPAMQKDLVCECQLECIQLSCGDEYVLMEDRR